MRRKVYLRSQSRVSKRPTQKAWTAIFHIENENWKGRKTTKSQGQNLVDTFSRYHQKS